MNVKTHLANALEQAKAKSDYDEYVIRILSNKYILANILQGTISECKRLTIPQIIESMKDTPEIKQTPVHPCVLNDVIIGDRTEDKVPDEGTTTFDIRFHIYLSDAPQPIKLIINVEAQKNYYLGMTSSHAVYTMVQGSFLHKERLNLQIVIMIILRKSTRSGYVPTLQPMQKTQSLSIK